MDLEAVRQQNLMALQQQQQQLAQANNELRLQLDQQRQLCLQQQQQLAANARAEQHHLAVNNRSQRLPDPDTAMLDAPEQDKPPVPHLQQHHRPQVGHEHRPALPEPQQQDQPMYATEDDRRLMPPPPMPPTPSLRPNSHTYTRAETASSDRAAAAQRSRRDRQSLALRRHQQKNRDNALWLHRLGPPINQPSSSGLPNVVLPSSSSSSASASPSSDARNRLGRFIALAEPVLEIQHLPASPPPRRTSTPALPAPQPQRAIEFRPDEDRTTETHPTPPPTPHHGWTPDEAVPSDDLRRRIQELRQHILRGERHESDHAGSDADSERSRSPVDASESE